MKLQPLPRGKFAVIATPILLFLIAGVIAMIGLAMTEGSSRLMQISIFTGSFILYIFYVFLALRRAKDINLPQSLVLLYFTLGVPTGIVPVSIFIVHPILCLLLRRTVYK